MNLQPNNDYISIVINKDKQGFAVKSNICLKDFNIHCNSKLLENKFFSSFDAYVIYLLKKYNYFPNYICHADEFGMGGLGKSLLHGITMHPFNDANIVGGSSSGICKAVALKDSLFGIGSTTGGSITVPAALCNLFSFEPSYGVCSRFGLITFASSLDKIGIVTRNFDLLNTLMRIIIHKDPNDMTNFELQEQIYDINFSKIILVFNIQILKNFVNTKILNEYMMILNIIQQTDIQILYLPDEILTDKLTNSRKLYDVLSCAEAFSSLQRFNGFRLEPNIHNKTFEEQMLETRLKLGEECKIRLEKGKYILEKQSDLYKDCLKQRVELSNYFYELFKKNNATAIFMPSIPVDYLPLSNELNDNEKNSLLDTFCTWNNLILGCNLNFPVNNVNFKLCGLQGMDFALLNLFKYIQNYIKK